MTITDKTKQLVKLCAERILVLDGAMGTMIQKYRLTEADYRGERFADWPQDVKGNNDLLCITQPHIIREIHGAFLEAGADIIETNSFNGTTISQSDYGMQAHVRDINLASAKVAREAADEWSAKTPDKPRFVAGSLGPMNVTLSISPDVNNPGYRAVTFDEVKAAYRDQAAALIDGGVDVLLVETIFDTLNAKAAIVAIEELFDDLGARIPLMISGTITDLSGRNLSGQTMEAFWHSVRHANPFSIGMNCSFGAEQLRPHVSTLSRVADARFAVYPNAGLPNEMGEYDESPEETAAFIRSWADDGLLNMVGGCCGTTPDHIKAIADAVEGVVPRVVPRVTPAMRLSGLEAFSLAS